MTTKTYTINTPGAKTLADARTYMIDGKPVTAEVTDTTITIMVGCTIAHTAPRPNGLDSIAAVADYVIATLTAPKTNGVVTEPSRRHTVVIDNIVVQDAAPYDIITPAHFHSQDCVGCGMGVRAHTATHTRETYTPAMTGVVNVRATLHQTPVCGIFAKWHNAHHR